MYQKRNVKHTLVSSALFVHLWKKEPEAAISYIGARVSLESIIYFDFFVRDRLALHMPPGSKDTEWFENLTTKLSSHCCFWTRALLGN